MHSLSLTSGRSLLVQNAIPALAAHDGISWTKECFVTTILRKIRVSQRPRVRKASLGEHPSLSFLSLVPPPASFSPPQSTHLHRRRRPVAWVPSPSFSTVTTVSGDACSFDSFALDDESACRSWNAARNQPLREDLFTTISQPYRRPPADDLLQGRLAPIGGGVRFVPVLLSNPTAIDSGSKPGSFRVQTLTKPRLRPNRTDRPFPPTSHAEEIRHRLWIADGSCPRPRRIK